MKRKQKPIPPGPDRIIYFGAAPGDPPLWRLILEDLRAILRRTDR